MSGLRVILLLMALFSVLISSEETKTLHIVYTGASEGAYGPCG